MTDIEKCISELEIRNDLNVQQQMIFDHQKDLVLSEKQLEDLLVSVNHYSLPISYRHQKLYNTHVICE